MSNSKFDHGRYENQISQIIETSLIDLYGTNGYKSIIQTMIKECGKSEKEITGNYELFAEMIQEIFGRIGDSKILDPIKMEINRIGMDKTNHIKTESIPNIQTKQVRLLIADDEPHLLELYQDWLKLDNRHVITAENGQKCLEIYQKEHSHSKTNQLENYFDVVILDHNMPVLSGLQTAIEILKINPSQRIIFASGHIEKIVSDSLMQFNRAIEVIKKPFSIEALDDMINNKTLLNKLEKININQKEETISERFSNVITILNNYHCKS
ncbi:MAG TPA: response regulator [Nitrosarchaeum sp.]|nr:response regulator [Nitrosarchaeum sp.]